MLDISNLEEMSRTEIDKVDRSTLVDIKSVQISTSLPIAKRMLQYLEQIKNPYCFLCGNTPVRVQFSDKGKTLDEAIKSHFQELNNL